MPAKPLVLHVERLHIGGASAALADFTPREPFKRTVGPLDITLEHFRTDPDNKNPYAFTGTTPSPIMGRPSTSRHGPAGDSPSTTPILASATVPSWT